MLRSPTLLLILAASLSAGTMLHAQILSSTGDILGGAAPLPRVITDRVGRVVAPLAEPAGVLARARLNRLTSLVRRYPQVLEWVDNAPAVRGQITAIDPAPATLQKLLRVGFSVLGEETIEGVDVRSVTIGVPRGWSLRTAMDRLPSIAPEGIFSPIHIYEPSGRSAPVLAASASLAAKSGGPARIAIIDGGVAAHPSLAGPVEQRGFAKGAPRVSAHGTAVASLISGSASPKGVLPGEPLLVADVYGLDPAGGNAVAIARAIGWAVARGAAVANISLVGPPNPFIAATVRAARARGLMIVAPVGNDGPATPPAYPAAYPEVISVTAVNGRNRLLAEAGRALHLDYAAPGADMAAATIDAKVASVRGTSYAAPLVAARLFAHYPVSAPERTRAAVAKLDAEARDLGPAGADKSYGRGLLCGTCRPTR